MQKDSLSPREELVVGVQHLIAMFGATILVPLLTGLSVSVALFASGLGTMVFHYLTKNKVPAYLGSSFAFIAPITVALNNGSIGSAQTGIIGAGIVYVLASFAITKIGKEKILKVFPPIVTGPIIMIIGLYLADVAIDQASSHYGVALITLLAAVVTVMWGKGLWEIVPIITGVIVGYIAAVGFGLVDLSSVAEANWLGLPEFSAPAFNINALVIIAPVALVSIIEHVGDVLAISETIGKGRGLAKDPGVNRTMLGDGVATIIAGLVGAPPNTTYGENIGVLNITGVYKTRVVKVAAVLAIILSFIPKITEVIQSIPESVVGGISILLFGMIASVGIKTLIDNKVDFRKSRNLVISSTVLVIGLGGAVIEFGQVEFSGMALAAVVGILLHLILPKE